MMSEGPTKHLALAEDFGVMPNRMILVALSWCHGIFSANDILRNPTQIVTQNPGPFRAETVPNYGVSGHPGEIGNTERNMAD